MKRSVQRLLQFVQKNLLPVIAVLVIFLVLFTFAVPRVVQRVNQNGGDFKDVFGGLRRDANEAAYNVGAPASAPMESVAGGAGGNYPVRGKADYGRMEEMEQKSAELSSSIATDANKGAHIDIMNSAYAAEVFKPQIIKTANMTLEVENIVTSVKQIENLTTAHGGLITNKNVSIAGENNEYRSGNIQVRVPQSNLDKFLDSLHAMGIPHQENVSSEDVGGEVVDLESRIRNSKAQETVLLTIMNRAGKIPDVLQAAQELARVRQEVEQMQGRLNYLRQQVAYSTVNIQLSEKALTSPTQGKPSFFNVIGNSAKKAFGDLIDFVNVLTAMLVGMLIFWVPVLVILWLASTLLWRFLLKRPLRSLKDKWCSSDKPGDE